MAFDAGQFVDQVASTLVVDAPADVQNMVFASEKLQAEVQGFVDEAKSGLALVAKRSRRPEELDASLRARKSLIVAACPAHAFSVEKLVSKALEQFVQKARELAA